MAKQNYFDQEYIGDVKEQLGYDRNSMNLHVQSGGGSFMIAMFGAFAAASARYYNMSLEDNGILFIQRNVLNNKLEPEKFIFVSQDEIEGVVFKKGLLQHKFTIVEKNGKKTKFRVFKKGWKKMAYVTENAAKLEEIYGQKK